LFLKILILNQRFFLNIVNKICKLLSFLSISMLCFIGFKDYISILVTILHLGHISVCLIENFTIHSIQEANWH